MFEDNDKDNVQPLDFKTLKKSIADAAEPVVEAVQKYKPYAGKGKYKPDEELPETLADFFRGAAEAVEAHAGNAKIEEIGDQLSDARLDKKIGDVASSAGAGLGAIAAPVVAAISDLAGKASDTAKDAKLDKRLSDVADNVKDTKLDKKAGGVIDTLTSRVKDVQLDKKAGDVVGTLSTRVKEAQLDKKAADVVDTLTSKVKEAELNKKAADVVDTLSSKVKEAELDKKAAGLAGTLGEVALPVLAKVKEAELNKKAADVVDTLSGKLKEAELDKKAADVADSLSTKVKEARLDKKAADIADTLSSKVKDAKLDKKLADAKLPEKAFAAAALVPGIEIKNPKKAAKQFRKRRKEVLKAVNAQQKDLNKALKKRQIDAAKYIAARQRDIQTGKIRIPGYEPPKPKASFSFPWGRTLAGAGLVYGGLAANNLRVWANVPPLQSKLPGEGHYYRSRQGVIFYKEAGQDHDNQPPVVFVHGIGAGNHSYEWQPNFGAIAEQYKVYAFDLLGFGNSERPAIRYTAETYIKQLTEFLDQVVARPAIVIASSLCSSYAVQVAFRRPQLIQKLVLMEPTGIFRNANYTGPNLVGPLTGVAYSILRAPVLGKAIYSAVASRSGIKSFMQSQMFYDKGQATQERIEQYWVAAHQDGAEYAPPSFFTGLLNAEIGETLGKIQQPVQILWGKESLITPPQEREELSKKNPNAQVETIERARLALNQEHPDQFNRLVLDFLKQPAQSITDAPAVGFVHNAGSALESVGNRKEQGGTGSQASGQANERSSEQSGTSSSETRLKPNQVGGSENVTVQQTVGQSGETSLKPTQTGGAENVKVQPMQAAEAATQSGQQGLEYDNSDLQQELEEHRKTFIGDAETGRALVQDSDNDGVDDRTM